MALKKSGISLVVEGYSSYLNQLSTINRAHAQTFNGSNFKSYEEAAKKVSLKPLNNSLDEALSKSKGLFNSMTNTIKPVIGNVGDLTGMLGGMLGKFTLVAAALKLVNDAIQFFSGSLAVAQRNETLAVSLTEIGGAAGYSGKQIKLATQLLNKQGITTQAAQQSLLLMARANISWGEASKLAAIAQGSAVVAGMNSSQAFERLVRGIQKMEPELLDELGITLRRTEAYEKFAATVNKNAKELSEAEKKQAILNEIYAQSESVIGVYGAAMETSGKQQASLARYIEETQNNVGKLMLPMAAARIEMETSFWKAAQQLSKGLANLSPILQGIGTEFETFRYKISLTREVQAGYEEAEKILKKFGIEGAGALNILQTAIEGINKGTVQKDLLKALAAEFEAQGSNAKEAEAQAKILLVSLQKYDEEIKKMAPQKGFWEGIGEGIYNFARIGVAALVYIGAVLDTTVKAFQHNFKIMGDAFTNLGKVFELTAKGEFAKAGELLNKEADTSFNFGEKLQANFDHAMKGMLDKFPALTKGWGDLNEKIEGTSDDLNLPKAPEIEDTTAALEDQITALEALAGAYKSIQNIQKSYQKEIADAEKDYQKGLADAEKDYQKEKAQMIKQQAQKLMEFDAENARKRTKMFDDFAFDQQQNAKKFEFEQVQNRETFNLKQNQDQQKFYDDNKRAYRAFQLSMMQQQRQFQISDRRMRADGDVLALMEARENFVVQQQENRENFDNQVRNTDESYHEQQKIATDNFKLQEEQAKQSFAQQTEMQREEFQRRVADFDANAALEREKMLAANAQALVDLEVKFEEEKAKLLEQYQERLALAEEHRQEQMTALGDSLKEEGKITEEGMKEIQDKVAEVFGEGAGGDALIKGWADRTKDEMSVLVDQINADIARMKAAMESGIGVDLTQDGRAVIPDSEGASSRPGRVNRPLPPNSSRPGFQNRRPIGARHGYEGTVTGPATFQVEPGVREHVSFTPTSRFGNVRVGGRVGVDVTGMSQGVSPQVEESVANTFLEEIRVAVKRLSRRHS